MKTLVDSKII